MHFFFCFLLWLTLKYPFQVKFYSNMALLCSFRRLPSLHRSAVQVTVPWLSVRAAAPLSVSRPALASQLTEDHVKHWNAERLLTVGLLGVLPAAFVFPSPALDYAVALSVAVHSHWSVPEQRPAECEKQEAGGLRCAHCLSD